MFSCTGAALTKILLGPTVCGGKWKESQMTTSKPTKKRKGEVLKNDWPKLPLMEIYCFYGAWLNRYINLPACFHKDQKLRGLVGMIPFHRSKPGIVLGKKICFFLNDPSCLFQFSPLSFSAMLSSMVLELNFRSCRSNTKDWGTGLLQITLLARECLNTSLCNYLIPSIEKKAL